MPQIVNLLIIIVGLFITGLGLVISQDNPILYAVVALGIGLIIAAYFSDKRREQRKLEQQRTDTAKRVEQLTQSAWHAHQALEIRGGQWLFILTVIVGLVSIFSLYTGITAVIIFWPFVFVGGTLLLFTLIMLPVSLASLGKPTLILDREGFVTPLHGRLSWAAVDGINLQKYTINGVTQCTLIFRVKNYQNFVTEPLFFLRILAFFGLGAIKRGIINVIIKNSNEQPDTIYAVSRFLWKSATGRDYEWSPLLSEAYNDAAKRMSNVASQHLDSANFEKRLQERPDEVLAEIKQTSDDLKLKSEEQARIVKKSNRIAIVVIMLLLLGLGWKLLM